jgi:PAS domain S-box-containing protein
LTGAILLGKEKTKLRGRGLQKFIATESMNDYYETLKESDRSDKKKSIELLIIRDNGESRWVNADIQADHDKTGILYQWRLVLTDITDRVNLENQLVQARKMESMGTLAGGIAHDFNNILQPIIGYTEISISDLPDDHPVQENLDHILKGAKRARGLIKQILSFSSQKKTDKEPLLIQPLILEATNLLRSVIPANIEIQQELLEDSFIILGNISEIHEIIMNLCTNAFHAMEDTGGILRITLDKAKPDSNLKLSAKGYCCLTVSDTGTGISSEIMNKIFDPYFTTKELGKGTGLGLPVVHGIVKSYDGTITFESKPGKGSVFNVYLPLTDKIIKLEDTPTIAEKTNRGNEKILFVDDEESIVKLSAQLLERLGYNVTGMTNCIEAFALFESDISFFDLVITDMAMPTMVGTEFAKKILELRPDIPIIICTGFSSNVSPETAVDLGIKEYLPKPVLGKDLISKVRETLDQKRKVDKNNPDN